MAGIGFRGLIERHCQTLRTNVVTLRTTIDRMWLPGADAGRLASEAAGLAHQMAGAGGSIGFRQVSVAAKALEERLRPLTLARFGQADRADVTARLDLLVGIVGQIRPETSSLYDMDAARPGAAEPSVPARA